MPAACEGLRKNADEVQPAEAYAVDEAELSVAAEPVAHTLQVGKRGRGRPPKGESSGSRGAEQAILAYLRAHPGWHGKAAVLEATGVDAEHWNAAIKALLEAGKVERQGEKKGARYKGKTN